MARPSCFKLLTHWMRLAAERAAWTAGSSRPIRTAMIAMTTRSSMSVNPRDRVRSNVCFTAWLPGSVTGGFPGKTVRVEASRSRRSMTPGGGGDLRVDVEVEGGSRLGHIGGERGRPRAGVGGEL